MFKGIDVSHYQLPSAVPYGALRKAGFSFVYINATDGIKPDARVDEHTKRARDAGLDVGFYCFWMQQQDPEEQARALRDTVEPLGYGLDWLAPSLDLEWQPGRLRAQPSLFERAQRTAEMFREWWGGCIIYTASAFWAEMGRPAWWTSYPLWIADYSSSESKVRSLGDAPWAIWQHASEPIPGLYAHDIDQNVARELPRVMKLPETFDDVAARFIPLARDIEAERRDRDRSIRDAEE